MWSLFWTISLLCLISCNALIANVVKRTHHYDAEREVIFDEQPIRNNTFAHAVCKVDRFREEMGCTIFLKVFAEAKYVRDYSCHIRYKAEKARQIGNQYRVKKLFNIYMAFAYSDEEKLQSDVPKKHLVLSVINMHNCKSIQYGFNTDMDNFHIIPYDETFDVYYHDKKLCDSFMCGETFDSRGRILNGPTASYLPAEYFNGYTQMCSVQSNSSSMGHYLITPSDFHLVTGDFGKKMQMGSVPFDAQVAVYACDKEFLGYCWLTNNKRIVNCEQFNPRGRMILSTGESLDYQMGTWMAMRNLGASELLLLVNRCDAADSCISNTKDVTFHVLKMNTNGNTEELHKFQGLECNNARDIKSEVIRKEDGQICATLACHVRHEEGQHSVNLLSTCFQL